MKECRWWIATFWQKILCASIRRVVVFLASTDKSNINYNRVCNFAKLGFFVYVYLLSAMLPIIAVLLGDFCLAVLTSLLHFERGAYFLHCMERFVLSEKLPYLQNTTPVANCGATNTVRSKAYSVRFSQIYKRKEKVDCRHGCIFSEWPGPEWMSVISRQSMLPLR